MTTTEYECQVNDKTFYLRIDKYKRRYISIQFIDKPGGIPLEMYLKDIEVVTWVEDNCLEAIEEFWRYLVPFGTKYQIIYKPTDTPILTIESLDVMRVRAESSTQHAIVSSKMLTTSSEQDLESSNGIVLYF
jgi:hypothetical protein